MSAPNQASAARPPIPPGVSENSAPQLMWLLCGNQNIRCDSAWTKFREHVKTIRFQREIPSIRVDRPRSCDWRAMVLANIIRNA